jgi:predicted MFS family arabinose efflux permease
VALANSIWVAAPLLMLTGVANMWFLIPSITLVQQISREDLRGRVLAARQTITRIASAVSIVIAGAFVERVSIDVVILVVGATVTLAAVWGWTRATLKRA